MIAALINEENREGLSGWMPDEVLSDADILIGAYDPASMAIAGVLTAEVLDPQRLGITWIYVDEEFRRCGAGREMLGTLAQTVLEIKAPDFIVCSYAIPETEGVYRLLSACGFIEDRQMHAEILATRLADCAVSKGDFPGRIIPLAKVSQSMWEELSHRQSIADAHVGQKRARPMDDRAGYDAAHSVVALDENDEPVGELLVSYEEKTLWGRSLFSISEGSEKILRALVSTTIELAKQSLPEDTVIQILSTEPQVEKLVRAVSANRAIKTGELITQMADARMIEDAVYGEDTYRFMVG